MDKKSLYNYIRKSSKYVSTHATHYKNIFEIYVETVEFDKTSIELFELFIKLFINLQLCMKNNKWKKNLNNLIFFSNLFKTILTTIVLDDNLKHHCKIILLYLKLIKKRINKIICSDKSSCSNSDKSCKYPLKENKCNIEEVTKQLKCINHIYLMLITIFTELQRDYVQKINCYNLYDVSATASSTDNEYHNKLIQTIYNQITTLLSSSNLNIFNNESDTQEINVFLKNGKSFTLCIIDNIRVRLQNISGVKTLVVDIGLSQFLIKFLSDGITNGESTIIMKNNFISCKDIIYAIESNNKSIDYWIHKIHNINK